MPSLYETQKFNIVIGSSSYLLGEQQTRDPSVLYSTGKFFEGLLDLK